MNEPPRKARMEIIPPPQKGGKPQPPAVRPAADSRPGPWRRFFSHLPGAASLVGLWLYMLDDEAPDGHRLAILASFIYLILPNDILWDFVFGPLGYVDDMAVFMGLMAFLGSENMRPYRAQARRWLKGERPVQ